MLRTQRGLTQKQLAGDEFTKAFISQIETGFTRMSLRAAHVFSARLGVSVTDLLDAEHSDRQQQAGLLQAEAELAAGSPEVALKLTLERKATGPDRARLLRLRGRALLKLDRAREALAPLNEAMTHFRAAGQLDLVGRVLYEIALAHARLDESEEAILSALECERAIKAGEVIDATLELQVRTLLASAYVRRGDFASADLQIGRALKLAEDVTSREARAALYSSLAKSEQERGDFEKATRLWRRSLDELESLGWEQPVAEAWNSLALVYRDRAMPREARAALSRAAAIAEETAHHRLVPWIALTRAKLLVDEHKDAEAEEVAAGILRDHALSNRARAEAQLVIAQVLYSRRAPLSRVRKAFEDALTLAAEQPSGFRTRILRKYADALEARGELKESVQRLRQALDLVRPMNPQG